MSGPRILFWDIETTHNLAAVFSLFNQNYISHENVVQERYIVCAAWKWAGKRTVETVSVLDNAKRFRKDVHDDYHVVKALHSVLSQADVIVHHNGDAFDLKYLTARAIFHGLPKLPPIKTIDTKKIAKAKFYFNSNRLDYLGAFLKLGRKIETPRGLWLKVLNGDRKAITTMVRYNKGDVRLLEKIFNRFLPYIDKGLNRQFYVPGKGCPRCGGPDDRIQSRGTYPAEALIFPRYQCQSCSGWLRGRESVGRVTHRMVA